MHSRFIFFVVFFVLVTVSLSGIMCRAQEIPLGAWRTHNSYSSIHSIAIGPSNVYGASANGLVVVDPLANELKALTKLDGLSGVDITDVAYDQPRNQVLLSYADGTMDIVRQQEIIQYTRLKDSPTIPGSKRINHITIRQGLAYLSADYGVVVFDLAQLEVKETWRDLGPQGQTLRILESTFLQDSVFLATANGVIAGNISSNLLDFANWKRFSDGPFSAPIISITVFNAKVYTVINGAGLYAYESGKWSLINFSGSAFNRLGTGSHLYVTENSTLWKLNSAGIFSKVESDKIAQPFYAAEDGSGKLWIADLRNGLVSDRSGIFMKYIPNGPTFYGSFRLRNNNKKLYAVSGGYTSLYTPAGKSEQVNYFTSGVWQTDASLIQQDVTDLAFSGTKMFVSTFGSGLQVIDNGISLLYTNVNSPLSTNRITAMASSSEGIWVTNYGAPQPLHLLKNDNTWQSFSFPGAVTQFPTQLLVDGIGQVWMALNPAQGGGLLVFNRERNQHVYLNEATGTGALPSRSVYALAVDRDGQVWVGTAAGVAYFPNPAQVFSSSVNAVKPIFNGRFLLRDETVTTIAVDGGNRKWIGTQRGVWLFDPFGENQVYNFNTTNSPVLSDVFVDIEIEPTTGEVFFGTDKGIVSYRADATEAQNDFSDVRIFPNPVLATFTGEVSISGLAMDARVKVTDISGRLIWQTEANGGTATWNVRDYNGRRASTGMYLVIAVSRDASESIVGKIAVIN
jgi:hypothetical protein